MVKRRFFTFYAAKLLLFFEIRKKKEYFFLFFIASLPHRLIALSPQNLIRSKLLTFALLYGAYTFT